MRHAESKTKYRLKASAADLSVSIIAAATAPASLSALATELPNVSATELANVSTTELANVSATELVNVSATELPSVSATESSNAPSTFATAALPMHSSRLVAAGKFAVSVAVTLAVIHFASELSALGYDWGYGLVKAIAGQPSGDDQGAGAVVLSVWVIPSVTAGIVAGYLRLVDRKWSTIAAIVALGLFLYGGISVDWRDVGSLGILGAATVALIIPITIGSILANRLYQELKLRTKATVLICSLLAALVPACLISHLVGSWNSVWSETAAYAACIFGAGFAAPIMIRARTRGAAFSASFFATLPLTIFNLINIVFTLVSNAVFSLSNSWLNIGWHATLSALVITVVTAVAATAGGACGGAFARSIRSVRGLS